MPGQENLCTPVIVTLPVQVNAATAEQVSAAFGPGVTVVIADLTSAACRDCSAIPHLLRAPASWRRRHDAGHCLTRLDVGCAAPAC